jgi:hypothetical protein
VNAGPALRLRRAFVLGALLVSTWIAAAPVDVLNECAASATAKATAVAAVAARTSGIKDLGALCPQLEQTLETLGLESILYDGWREQLNSRALLDLTGLVQRYSESQRRAAPNTASLPPILQALTRQQTPAVKSRWDALKSWFQAWLAHNNSALARWLNQWLEQAEISGTALNAAIYCLMVLAVIAATIVVVREFRASGFTRRRGAALKATPDVIADTPVTAIAAQSFTAVGVRELLQSLINRLLQTGRLKIGRSLTHRELIARGAFDSEAQRIAFAGVARTAESLLYGSQGAAPETLDQVTRDGQALLMQLSSSAGAP